MDITCVNPWAPTPVSEKFVRCGECVPCKVYRQLEWKSRLYLEDSFNPSWPIFFTLTYSQENLPPDTSGCLVELQKFWKRVRKKGIQVRYLVVTERGEKRGRLHHHGILWSKQLAELDPHQRQKLMQPLWNQGFTDRFENVRSKKGLGYCVKYIFKGGDPYQWSKRPMLGHDGLNYYRSICNQLKLQNKLTAQTAPVWIRLKVLGSITKVYIHQRTRRRVLDSLGVQSSAPVTPEKAFYKGVPSGQLDKQLFNARIQWQNGKVVEAQGL